METGNNFDYERFKEEAIQGLSEGKKWGGADGVFGPMLKHLLESMLEGELNHHLAENKATGVSNRRNGKTKKTVRSLNSGHLEIESSRDREGTFTPKIIPKRQLIVTSELEDKVLAMYAKGMSTRDISGFILEMYAMEISATEISHITDSVIPMLNEWRTRPLEAVYPFVFLDCIHYKVRESGTVKSRAIYNILGVNKEGKKELLGVYVSENEGAKFWLSVLTDLKQRGVQDIFIACIDGLNRVAGARFPRGCGSCLSPDAGAVVHRPPDTHHATLRGRKGQERSGCRPEAYLQGSERGKGLRDAARLRGQVGAEVPAVRQSLGRQLGQPVGFLRVRHRHPAHDLHHQCNRGDAQADQESNRSGGRQNKGCFHLGYGAA